MTSSDSEPGFLAGGGVMGERIRAFPWRETALGDPAHWPQGLRTAVRIMLTSHHPIFIFWGTDHLCFYNDAYARSLGPEKHPAILGTPGRSSWAEIWPIIGPQIDYVMRGEGSTWHENQLVPIFRHGALQEVYWTYSYGPIDEPQFPSGVGGVLVITAETTEQVLTQRRLAEEREQFAQLFDQSPTFLALLEGPEHVFTYVNPEYLKVIGHREVIGRTVGEAIPEAVEQGYVMLLDDAYTTGKAFSASNARLMMQAAPEGSVDERFIDFVYQPMTDASGDVFGILVQGVDVTDRAVSDRALALDRSRLEYATRLSGVGFWYSDLPFAQLEWDDQVKEHFFLPPEAQVTIDTFYERMHEADRAPTRAAIERSISEQTPYDIVYRTVNPETGAIKWIRALGGAVYERDGSPTRFDGVTVDVSAQKRDEQHLVALNDRLQEQDRRKDEFIATLSHELRNPLAPIRAAAHVITSPGVEPAQLQRAQHIIERQVTHMALLLDDLLDMARITQGKLRLKREVVALLDVVDAAVEALAPQLESKRQRLSTRLPTEHIRIEGDPLRLAQIISNLLTNASKCSDVDNDIVLSGDVSADMLILSVRDNGIGIAPECLSGIFEMYAQVDVPAVNGDGGLGIGLSLVKGLTELHGGTVHALSEGIGHGSEFVVRLPLASALTSTSHDTAEPTTRVPNGQRVLVVDDNRDAADSLAMLLTLEGHSVRTAYSGKTAISLATEFRPDTMLLDIGLPDLNGYEVAETVGREPWAASVQLIALTGWGQEDDVRRARQAGFHHHLVKPVDIDRLMRLLSMEQTS